MARCYNGPAPMRLNNLDLDGDALFSWTINQLKVHLARSLGKFDAKCLAKDIVWMRELSLRARMGLPEIEEEKVTEAREARKEREEEQKPHGECEGCDA